MTGAVTLPAGAIQAPEEGSAPLRSVHGTRRSLLLGTTTHCRPYLFGAGQ